MFVGGGGFFVYKKGGTSWIKDQITAVVSKQEYPEYYVQKTSIFNETNKENPDFVFLGDSITDHGEFENYFMEKTVLNRGISNDNSKGTLNRVGEIVDRNPGVVFIMVGVNDILYDTPIKTYEKNIIALVEELQRKNITVVIQSILPVNNELYGQAISNESIVKFNEVLKRVSSELNCEYVNLNSEFSGADGQLKKEYTIDGLHLTGAGYKKWAGIISAREF